MQPSGFELLYEEGACLVVHKPAGLLTQAPPGIDSLEVRLRRFLRARDRLEGKFYLAIAHRLDRPVSGALLAARNVRAARRLTEQFEMRTIAKRYWALLEGSLADDAGTWFDHVRKVPDVPRAEVVAEGHPEGKPAELRFTVRGRFPGYTWVEIELLTGRMHQIRLQAGVRGHAVLGDSQYGAVMPFGPRMEDERARPIALHARSLEFRHPQSREAVRVAAPLADPWPPLSPVETAEEE